MRSWRSDPQFWWMHLVACLCAVLTLGGCSIVLVGRGEYVLTGFMVSLMVVALMLVFLDWGMLKQITAVRELTRQAEQLGFYDYERDGE